MVSICFCQWTIVNKVLVTEMFMAEKCIDIIEFTSNSVQQKLEPYYVCNNIYSWELSFSEITWHFILSSFFVCACVFLRLFPFSLWFHFDTFYWFLQSFVEKFMSLGSKDTKKSKKTKFWKKRRMTNSNKRLVQKQQQTDHAILITDENSFAIFFALL